MTNNKVDRLARELNDLKARLNGMNTPQLSYSSIEDGSIKEYGPDGQLVSIIGKQADGTHGMNVVSGPIPPAPAFAEVAGGTGVIRVKWNGQFANNNVAPLDFARVEAHISDSPGFEFDPLPNSATRAGTIEGAGGGEVALIRTAGTYYIKLITRATTGKYSEPTAEFSVVVDPVVSQQELAGILDEVEQANTDLAALQITLGNVQTDLANAEDILAGVDEIDGRLTNLEVDLTTLSGEVANAEAAANNAVTEAQAAASTAGAAQAAADAAATAASNAAAEAGAATQAAQNAEAEALAIANIVAEKSTVYYGSTEPAGDPNGLWIKDGKPYLWDGTNWVEQTNPELVQAVADASTAKADAADALSAATQAAQDAAAAQTAAEQAALDAGQAQSAASDALSAAASAETAAQAAASDAMDATDASNAASAAAGAAQLAADAASSAAQDADAAADAAVSQANDALAVAADALTAGQNALATAGTAETKATNALSEAQNAASDAVTAIGTANAATTAANNAQAAADNANAEALAAAGLAGSKGEVIYQATAPTGSRAVPQNLWIRTTDNKPHTYNTTQAKWVAVTDKAATDAATAAASANSLANNAWNLANTANGTANTALSTANGKNKVTYSLNAPGTTANTAGDIWFRKDSNNVIIGQWEGLGGTNWAAKTLGNTVIANLDAGKITSGYIDAARINAGTITVGMIKPGDVATPTQVTTAKNEAIAAAASDAQAKADAAKAAAETAAKAYADGEIDAAALATAHAAAADAQDKADAAKNAAISAAAADATSKANAAELAAIQAAATDAESKANAAKAAAELAAKQYADGEISASALATAQAAAADAQDKADAARDAAIAAAGDYTDDAVSPINTTLTLWKHPNSTLIDGGSIYTNSITANQIAAGAITADELAANAVTAAKINAGAVIAGKIATDAVTANTIAANAVTAGKINADAITAREIAANAVTASEIKAGAVVAGKIATDAVTAGTIAADAVAAGKVAADAITGREIKALSIDTEHLIAGSIVADKIATGAINADKLAANAVTADKIVGLTITGDKIAANAISADKIVANSITGDKLVANTITTREIKALAVTANEIAANAITTDKVQAGAINVGKLAAGTLSASNIEAGNINTTIGISTSGAITVGTVEQFLSIDSMGLGTYVVKNQDGTNVNQQVIGLGAGQDNFLSIANASGSVIAGIDAEGHIEGTSFASPGNMQIDGKLYLSSSPGDEIHDPLEFGPVINGQALLADSFLAYFEEHPGLGASYKWTAGLAYGIKTVATCSWSAAKTLDCTDGQTREIEYIKATFTARAGRAYKITVTNLNWRVDSASTRAVGERAGSVTVYRSSAGADVKLNSGETILRRFNLHNTSRSNYAFHQESADFSFYVAPGVGSFPAGDVTLLIGVSSITGISLTTWGDGQLIVEDIGRNMPNQDSGPTGVLVGSTYSGAGTPPAPPKKEYTKTYMSDWTRVWNPYGIDTQYHNNQLIAGKSNSGNSYRAYAGIPNMTSDLSGAEIVKAELYLYRRMQSYGTDNVAVGLHNAAALPSTEPTLTVMGSYKWGGNGGKWITIPSQYHAGLKSGTYRGIAVGRKSGPLSSELWAELDRHDDTYKPRIRITYKK